MFFARNPLLWLEKSAFACFRPKAGKEPENPRVGGSIPPLATINFPSDPRTYGHVSFQAECCCEGFVPLCPS
jgi:hypothetical protein